MKAMKKFYKECHLAARMYYDANEVWSDLKVGQLLQLRREADNSYDANAVQVIFTKPDENGEPEEFVLGYIPRDENTELAAFLNLGWGEIFECRISRINEDTHYEQQIHITIRIKRNPEFE